MRSYNQLKMAKMLLSFSLVLILIGIGLNLDEKKVMDPVLNTHTIGENETANINITTTQTPIKVTETSPPSNNPNNLGISGNNKNQITSDSPKNPIPNPPSIETTNDNLRKNIESKYKITVRYGVETNGYTVAGLSTEYLTDANRINQLLSELNYNLSLYPPDFLNETRQGGYTLTIYLIKRYSQNNVTGITDSTTKNVVISLATDYSYIESMHHELYHYIEKYMYQRGANYTTWNSLNPPGFNYGSENTSLSYANTKNANAFFVNTYAQTDQFEDRASTFEYMMSQNEENCLQTGTTIWKKAKYICEQIDAVFQSATPSTIEYWERFVYN